MPVLSRGQRVSVGQVPLLVERVLSSGQFGTVYKVSDSRRKVYALKTVVCQNPSSIGSVIPEVDTLTKAKHERIVQILTAGSYYNLASGGSMFLIVTEFCSSGDLNSRLNYTSSQETNLKWMFQLSEALRYLHSLNPPIVHRDLKADNVLLTDHLSQNLKLGDFGLAREYLAAQSARMYYMTSGVGPIHWMAPEVFHRHYTEKADVFSLGGIFYAILTRDFIQTGSKRMYGVYVSYQWYGKVGLGYAMAKINPTAVVLFPSSFQGSNTMMVMMQLIASMLSYDRHNRPTASQVHDGVKNICSSRNNRALNNRALNNRALNNRALFPANQVMWNPNFHQNRH